MVDAHIDVDASFTAEVGHKITVDARNRVIQRHRVLKLVAHVDPSHKVDLDHAST